ncbi:hypothetical protein [Endozoicomonas sp. SCSIO W0465]|uniref:hypothetical protein n=1 Tax=Endozoicomonas sp. SCSIO W0465 TaxID=2918516 RepID=UPI002076433A|nr:hypothetical protein [Endozoicomonas sp. SCSIO W0465]USE39520.1 hypothetical protein MJO57_15960 [Endozoicomonas sp. SCSIO W0465]
MNYRDLNLGLYNPHLLDGITISEAWQLVHNRLIDSGVKPNHIRYRKTMEKLSEIINSADEMAFIGIQKR